MERLVVVRLLNGSLRGCEFALKNEKTLFIIANENRIQSLHQSTILPEDMIFIPSKEDNYSFEVLFSAPADAPITIRDLSETTPVEFSVKFDTIVSVGNQKLAFRLADETFSSRVLSYSEETAIADVPAKKVIKRAPAIIVCALFIIAALCAGTFYFYNTESRKIAEVSQLLNTKVGDYEILHGRDNLIYVVAGDALAVSWAQQTIARAATPRTVRTLTVSDVANNISRWLAVKHPAIKLHRVLIASAKAPLIELSKERNNLTEAQLALITESLKQAFPYVVTPRFTWLSDSLVSKSAEDGLRKNAIPYTRVNNRESVTFYIQGSIDDGEIERMKNFLTAYYLAWGDEYVQFAVDIKDDRLKGKSFKYGNRGYVKLSPGHWFFAKPL